MKKLLAIALAVVMVMAMSVTAFAAEGDTSPVTIDNLTKDEANIPVNGRYDKDGDGKPDDVDDDDDTVEVIAVDIAWDSMEFTFTMGGAVWNPDTLKNESTENRWSTNTEEIKVTNRSNVDVDVKADFTKDAGINFAFDLDITVTGSEKTVLSLDSADNGETDEQNVATTGSFDVKVADSSATTDVTYDDNTQLGMITVTVEQKKAADPTPVTPYYVYGDDRDGLVASEITISADQEVEFAVACYVCQFDDDPESDRYSVKAVSCESASDAVEVASTYNIKFNQTGTFNVAVTLRCAKCQMDYPVTLTVTVE